jgi:sulfite reductase alpha subunit-like flavoprotein
MFLFFIGDVLTTQPSNLPENIDEFFEIFPDLVSAPPIYLEKNPKLPWSKISLEILKIMGPQPWSWNMIVTHILDIQSVPRLYFFELMSKFADNELEKEKLIEFCTPQGQEDLFSYCNRPKRNILEVFQDFHYTTQNIPPIFLFDLIPTIKPRSFSIASSRTQFPNSVQILVAVVEYQTKIKSKRKGLCSNWLAHHCPKGSFIPVWIQKGSFTFPPLDEVSTFLWIYIF